MPYICVDLSLNKQLVDLSAAAHMAFYLYCDHSACMKFMPVQSYVDIMIMIKNIYFCVTKTNVDHPSGKFYIILLGTDHLETFFGLIHTAVGTDSNVDTIQLGSCASGLTEVAVILTTHPEWDHGPRCLQLPVLTKESREITLKVGHINPASWWGNVDIENINLQTCWLLGCWKAIDLIPDAKSVFDCLNESPNINILLPLGQILVNQQDLDDDYDCSELAAYYSEFETPLLTNEQPTTEPML